MEPSSEVAVQPAPAPVVNKSESSFTESSQESKVEQIPNGTVESKSNTEKSVSQSVQSSVQVSGDQSIQSKSVVEEMKQETFTSSSSVVMQGSVTTGDGLEIPLSESIMPPIFPQPAPAPVETTPAPVVPIEAPAMAPAEPAPAVNNNFVINEEKPKEQEILTRSDHSKEIQQESIKKQLNEIITDIEKNVQITDDNLTENSLNDERLDGKKPIDLQKIFTPATDTDEIMPGKNRKLFASSSFYSPTIHPTVEDQVALAQRISHSLSDISNHTSKGQSMYVNRKKRSVKWIHDDGHEEERFIEEHQETKENGFESTQQQPMQQPQQMPQTNGGNSEAEHKKVPLKLLMDPRHVQDMHSVQQQYGYQPAPMSPEFGYELVNALNAPKGKGAELFAKRRKKAEKWVVSDGSNFQTSATTPTAGSTIIAFSDVGTQHVHRNIMQDQIQDKYQQPRVKMVRSPWEAALETGNADNAFVSYEQQNQLQQQGQQVYSGSAGNLQQFDYGSSSTTTSSSLYSSKKDVQYQSSKQIKEALSARDLAYRPSVPQGWNRQVVLPAGIYTPPEIAVNSSMTSSITSEKISKTTTMTSSFNSNEVSFPQQTAPLSFEQAPAPVVQPPVQQQKPMYQQQPKVHPKPTYQSAPQSFVPKPQTPVQQFVKTPPAVSPAPIKNQIPSPRQDAISPRSGFNASPVTPGILKKQIQLDAAVPVMPGGVVPCQSPQPFGRSGGKSPVPIFNTPPAPFGFPPLSIQTPETIAQQAPSPTPLVPHLQHPKPLPLIVNTPIPNYTSSYNNAARPFNEFKDFYRPINMDSVSHKLIPPVIYTDF